MNTCIKCGCQDAYPSLPPCPVPAACPNPQPCAEVFDAQCIVFTLPDIFCGEDIVVNQDDTIAEALDNIISYFCERLDTLTNYINSQLFVINNRLTTIEGEIIEINSKITSLTTTVNELIACCELVDGLVQSVTGLNTDNTDPQNPIVRISVDGTTITGLGTPASPLVAIGGIAGSGTNNYLARWTPSGTVLGIGLIQDNNTSLGIGIAPSGSATNGFVGIRNATNRPASLFVDNAPNVLNSISFYTNLDASLASSATGIYNTVTGSSQTNIGISNILTGAGIKNTGVSVEVSGGALNYSLKLVDGTEGIGKVLTDVTGNGEAHWVTPTGGGTIGGSGTTDYVARWTPNGTTLGNSVIRDSGTTIGIGTAPSAGQLVRALTTTQAVAYSITQAFSGSSKGIELVLSNGSGVCIGAEFAVRTNSSINVASLNEAGNNIYSFLSYIPTNSNIGSIVMAQDTNADNNYGLVSIVSLPSLTTNNHIGARFIVDNGVTNYGLQIEDGTEGVGKVLTCMTSDGKANWETTNKQKEITTSNYVLTNADNDYTIFINNGVTAISISLGAITVANFCVGFIQEGSADVTFVGVTNPVGLKLKGQGYQAFIERKLSTSTYYLLGNTKV